MSHETIQELTIHKCKIKPANETQYSFIGETREREEISKYIDKYVTFLESFDINLVILSVASRSIAMA